MDTIQIIAIAIVATPFIYLTAYAAYLFIRFAAYAYGFLPERDTTSERLWAARENAVTEAYWERDALNQLKKD